MWPNPQFLADMVTFYEEILNGKLNFCAVCHVLGYKKNLLRIYDFYSNNETETKKASE